MLRCFFFLKNGTDWQGYASLATMYRSLSEDVAILVFSATLSLMSRDGRSTVLLGDAPWKQSQCHGQFYVQQGLTELLSSLSVCIWHMR